jgi:hypothetical protein
VKTKINFLNRYSVRKKTITGIFNVLFVFSVFGGLNVKAQSSSQFLQGKDTLIVYKDVPGLTPSEFYSIRVRSAATNNQWVDCFANITRNRGNELTERPMTSGKVIKAVVQHYQKFTRGWSHTYGNIEMSKNAPVEVEISAKNGFKIDGKDFYKATAHPAQKCSLAKVVKGKIYFTITNPAQIVIDINGQMDDFNKAIDDKTPGETYVAHTISLFANPIMHKPTVGDSGVVVVEPGNSPPTNPDLYSTLYFKPGVHDIGINFKIYPNKKYFIPGDAIVYGTFNNLDLPAVGNLQSGENIKIYGLGTISGAKITHPNYVLNSNSKEYKSITVENALNMEVEGVCVVDPSNHSVNLNAYGKRPDMLKEVTFARWVKVISWRANGDGIGSAHLVEDCFIRTADDCSYIKGNRRRCTFWKDANAAVFHMSGIPDAGKIFPIIIEDCDVIYNRTRGVKGGGVFVQRAEGNPKQQRFVNVTVRNFRVSDPRSNMPTFNLFSKDDKGIGSSYSGITFQNVTITHSIVGNRKQILRGCKQSPWYGGITFDNVVIAGKKLTDLSDFDSNEFVSDIMFK